MPVVLALIFFAIGFVLLVKQLYLAAIIVGVFVVGLLLQTRKHEVIEFEQPYGKRKSDLKNL